MAASSRAQVLDLYRAMLRESKHFSAYNYRTYAVRRIRDAFRENKNVKDPVEIQALVNKAKRDLGIIRRQVSSSELKSMKRTLSTLQKPSYFLTTVPHQGQPLLGFIPQIGSPVVMLSTNGTSYSSVLSEICPHYYVLV
ncbi:LYR motif-containing protein 4 isoform X1 [Meles meles]|uniref:LYR motif-containing protein 4 isoform X1 n=1 Tax=Meles meles TaxID=9662 RepID=UPI001E69ED4B|nr:LYR motif-containing protein 4 isoform X1 [Meles meles]